MNQNSFSTNFLDRVSIKRNKGTIKFGLMLNLRMNPHELFQYRIQKFYVSQLQIKDPFFLKQAIFMIIRIPSNHRYS